MEKHEPLFCPSWLHADWSLIPSHMQHSIKIYVERGLSGGSFLYAVLCGDLAQAVARADHINSECLKDYVSFLSIYAPSACWGAKEKVEAWIDRGGLSGTTPPTPNGKPRIFAFVNGGSPGWYSGAAIAEDGTVLPAGHVSSTPEWSRHDMGADGTSTWKHDIYSLHYPHGFQVEWVENVKEHLVLWPIIEKLKTESAAMKAEKVT